MALTLTFEMLRPDDLLALQIQTQNLKLDTSNPKNPKLVIAKASAAAFLIVRFPPQSIAERAYFEADPNDPPGSPGNDKVDPPGSVPVRMSGISRLVFRLPAGTSIPYSIEGLLDWSNLELVLSSVATGVQQEPIPPPTPLETSIELPYRLYVSPSETVGWAHATTPETSAGRTELWHTRISKIKVKTSKGKTVKSLVEASESNPIPVRAIWSPDFVDHAPLLADTPGVAMDGRDRAEIVILTSGTLGYFVPVVGAVIPFTPAPVKASRLFLSALGGWLSSDGQWPAPPSYLATDGSTQSLDLVEWRHLATQGRDHYVKIVKEGYLYPFGNRAALIQVTERKVVSPDGSGGVNTQPVAYLKERLYVVVREPSKTYTPSEFRNDAREMPFWQNVIIKTVATPNIDKPNFIADGTAAPVSFWINVNSAGFPFHIKATDLAGVTVNFLAQMIFMDVGEQNPTAIQAEYRNPSSPGDQPLCDFKGQKVAYADPSAGDTILRTSSINFDTELLQTKPPYASVPFLPILSQAAVSISALEQLLGTTTSISINLFGSYLTNGLDGFAGVFAQIIANPNLPLIPFAANQSGGFATPNITLTALSARKGVVAGSPSDAAIGRINPTQFFDISAALFGQVPLQSLIATQGGTADATVNAPEIRSHYLPNSTNPQTIVTQLQWAPQLASYKQDPIEITFSTNPPAALTLKASLTRSLAGGPPSIAITGQLTNFQISLLGVIELSMTSLKFQSSTGQKSIVEAKLPSANPITFTGALAFVQDLANVLPPGIFGGAGPSIDLEPSELRVTYTLGLPSLSIGVFSLEHISLLTGLDLPYLSGEPGFEFGFASRSSPFLLTIECLGGGGFVHLIVTAKGVQMVEGALEFGGEFSIDLGVASGGVHIMAGIYFQLTGTSTTVTGFVDIGGEVSVLGIISISIDLNLSLTYETSNGKSFIQGKATLTISVHIIFFSISVSVSVERSFGNTSGDPGVKQMISESDWSLYAAAFQGTGA